MDEVDTRIGVFIKVCQTVFTLGALVENVLGMPIDHPGIRIPDRHVCTDGFLPWRETLKGWTLRVELGQHLGFVQARAEDQ